SVTRQVTGVSTPLSKSDQRYLDLLGNKNGKFDLGDFLAWVKETGAANVSARVAHPQPTTQVMSVAKRGDQ
ncbi:MAG TPA: hypothetical protein VGI83_04635, partial [Gemmatimonadales bacterium]